MSEHNHDECCGHDHNHDMEEEWIVLVDEEGTEYRYSLERVLELENKKYAILVPELQDEDTEADEAHVFRIDTDDAGDEVLVDVDDDEITKIQQALENEDWDDEVDEEE